MKIFTVFDSDAMTHDLWCDDGRMSPTPAGPRLFKQEPQPRISFSHETAEAAEEDAAILRQYLSEAAGKKK